MWRRYASYTPAIQPDELARHHVINGIKDPMTLYQYNVGALSTRAAVMGAWVAASGCTA